MSSSTMIKKIAVMVFKALRIDFGEETSTHEDALLMGIVLIPMSEGGLVTG